jgi:hypothetical protein
MDLTPVVGDAVHDNPESMVNMLRSPAATRRDGDRPGLTDGLPEGAMSRSPSPDGPAYRPPGICV